MIDKQQLREKLKETAGDFYRTLVDVSEYDYRLDYLIDEWTAGVIGEDVAVEQDMGGDRTKTNKYLQAENRLRREQRRRAGIGGK